MTPLNIYLLYLSILHSPINALQSPPDPTLTWGPYRPNLYFGLRPRIPETLLIALMWGHGEDDNSISSIAPVSACYDILLTMMHRFAVYM